MSEQRVRDAVTHTPGPWSVDVEDGITYEPIMVSKDGAPLASVYNAADFPCLDEDKYDEVELESQANARLIAAAPDLLAALKLYVDHFGDPLKVARAAIQKAEGQ